VKRYAVTSIWGHVLWVSCEGDLRQGQTDAVQACHEMGDRPCFVVQLVGEVKALTKPSGWERCFPREKGKRTLSGAAGDALVRSGRRFR
jgi:hypothetical protein